MPYHICITWVDSNYIITKQQSTLITKGVETHTKDLYPNVKHQTNNPQLVNTISNI